VLGSHFLHHWVISLRAYCSSSSMCALGAPWVTKKALMVSIISSLLEPDFLASLIMLFARASSSGYLANLRSAIPKQDGIKASHSWLDSAMATSELWLV
jgi:hypothetical protein